jgi:hypothetical protein
LLAELGLVENHSEVCEKFYKCLNCNKILKRNKKLVDEEGNKEHMCGWEKCRNCHKEVEILSHKCYMQWKRQKGGICETTMKDSDKKYKVKGCKNCDRIVIYYTSFIRHHFVARVF